MRLTSTSDLVQIITGSAVNVEVHATWTTDRSSGRRGRTNTIITTATTTTIVEAPGSNITRTIESLSVFNVHGASSNLCTIEHTDGTNTVTVWKGTLAAGESVTYDGKTWHRRNATGFTVVQAT